MGGYPDGIGEYDRQHDGGYVASFGQPCRPVERERGGDAYRWRDAHLVIRVSAVSAGDKQKETPYGGEPGDEQAVALKRRPAQESNEGYNDSRNTEHIDYDASEDALVRVVKSSDRFPRRGRSWSSTEKRRRPGR